MKYLLLLLIAAIVWWSWQKRALPRAEAPRADPPAPERMVACASCGVLMPESDSLSGGGKHYCCEAHRRADSGSR